MAPERTNVINGNQLRNASTVLTSTSGPQLSFAAPGPHIGNPPPLPPRPSQSYSPYSDYRPYGSSYLGNYGYGNYRGYGGYGSYAGGYSPYSSMSGYNPYGPMGGHSGDVETRFLQYAEESTRSTFRLVETVLQTFSSVTMMLESTYFAMTNSFRAILSVADNIGRLRSTLGQLLSTFALIRFLRWLYRRITYYIFGLQDPSSGDEDLWQRSLAQVTNGEKTSPSSWSPILVLGVFVVIPYLLHKISNNVKQMQVKGLDPKEWSKYDEPVYSATALYDFAAASSEELSLRAGQKVWIAPQSLQPKNTPGWCRATDSVNVGLIPSNYVTIVGQLKKKTEQNSCQTSVHTSAPAQKQNTFNRQDATANTSVDNNQEKSEHSKQETENEPSSEESS